MHVYNANLTYQPDAQIMNKYTIFPFLQCACAFHCIYSNKSKIFNWYKPGMNFSQVHVMKLYHHTYLHIKNYNPSPKTPMNLIVCSLKTLHFNLKWSRNGQQLSYWFILHYLLLYHIQKTLSFRWNFIIFFLEAKIIVIMQNDGFYYSRVSILKQYDFLKQKTQFQWIINFIQSHLVLLLRVKKFHKIFILQCNMNMFKALLPRNQIHYEPTISKNHI